jgi:hypothetical protein
MERIRGVHRENGKTHAGGAASRAIWHTCLYKGFPVLSHLATPTIYDQKCVCAHLAIWWERARCCGHLLQEMATAAGKAYICASATA